MDTSVGGGAKDRLNVALHLLVYLYPYMHMDLQRVTISSLGPMYTPSSYMEP